MTPELTPEQIRELNEREKFKIDKILEESKERKEKEVKEYNDKLAQKTKEEINNNKFLNIHGIKAYGRFYRIFSVVCVSIVILILIFITILFSWAIFTNNFDGLIASVINNTIINDYTFSSTTTNSYSNIFQINNSVGLTLDSSLINKICNNTI